MNAGQTCIAPDYVLVDESVKDRFVDLLTGAIGDFYGADPKATKDLGRIVNERHHDRLTGLLKDGGGTVAIGGDADRATKFLAPTVVVDPDLDSGLMNEEIFGPVLPVVSVSSVDEAISFVNARPKPLALYIFSKAKETADRVLERTSSGGACVSCVAGNTCNTNPTACKTGITACPGGPNSAATCVDNGNEPDGASCSGGTCLLGACCTGCVSGGLCRPGTTRTLCGLGGGACVNCGLGFVCTFGTCEGSCSCSQCNPMCPTQCADQICF